VKYERVIDLPKIMEANEYREYVDSKLVTNFGVEDYADALNNEYNEPSAYEEPMHYYDT